MEDRKRGKEQPPEDLAELRERVIQLERFKIEHEQSDKELRESEESFRTIFNSVNDAIFIHDLASGAIVDVNQRMCEMYGFTRDEALRIRPEDGSAGEPPYAVADVLKWMGKAAAGEPQLFEWRAKHKTGRLFWVEVNMRRAVIGAEDRLLVTVRDITERKRSEKALIESEARLRSILRAAPVGIGTVMNRVIVGANETLCAMTGYAPDELKAQNARLLYPTQEDFSFVGQEKYRQIAEYGTGTVETRWLRKDGAIIDVLLSSTPLDPGDPRKGVTFTALDITTRKGAEESLKESEEKYRSVFAAERDALLLVDRETGAILDVNDAACRLYGYAREEMLRLKNTDTSAEPEETERATQELKERIELRFHKRKDGTVFPVDISVSHFMLKDRQIILAAIRDITQRKEAEEALRESEERYRIAIEGSLDGISIVQNDVHVYANQSFLAMFGYNTLDEIVGKQRYWTVHPDDHERVAGYARARNEGEYAPTRYEFKGIRKDGTPIDIEVSVSTISYKGARSILAYLRDITERARMGQALRESETLQRVLLANIPAGVIIVDPVARTVESVNNAAAVMFGVEAAHIAGHRCHAFLCPADEGACPVLDLGLEVDNSEREMVCADGSRRPVLKFVKRIQIGGQEKLLECFLDITDRKRAEEERRKLESQLRQSQKMEAIGTLTGGIAHDFNNILMVLMGYGTLLKRNIDEGSPLRAYADQILSGSERAAQLTQTLLTFSRHQPIALNPLSLNDAIRGAEKLLKRLVIEDIDIRTVLAPHEIIVMADATQIDQILFNLATNARDAMPHGGVLTIETKTMELDEAFKLHHGYGEPGRYAVLSVSDTGTGMDEATKEKIFDPFFTTKEVGKGTGLGLSTVYGVVNQHNGYITVYSEPDMGTTFHIYLPVVGGADSKEESAPLPIKRGDETVLVAEDNNALRDLLRDVLTAYGYRVIEATDGADAVELFRKTDGIDLLILDSVMPKKNGREAYDEIRKIRPDIKVLFTSGYTRDVVLDKGIEDKEFDFISKPISPSALLQKVREVLDRS